MTIIDRIAKIMISAGLAAMVLLMVVGPAHADKSSIEVKVVSGKIVVICSRHDGSPIVDAGVSVYTPVGLEVAEGKTNTDGKFVFTPSANDAHVKIVVRDLLGHRAETTLYAFEWRKKK